MGTASLSERWLDAVALSLSLAFGAGLACRQSLVLGRLAALGRVLPASWHSVACRSLASRRPGGSSGALAAR